MAESIGIFVMITIYFMFLWVLLLHMTKKNFELQLKKLIEKIIIIIPLISLGSCSLSNSDNHFFAIIGLLTALICLLFILFSIPINLIYYIYRKLNQSD